MKKGAQTQKATGHPEPIDADEQLLYCCWMRGASLLPPNWWEEVGLVVCDGTHTEMRVGVVG